MKLDSKYFDGIRVRPASRKAAEKARAPDCAWDGCKEPGNHKAPRGRDHEGQYLNFCVDHVRQYNKSYNYFSGLNDTDIQTYLKDSLTGNRPTWTMGAAAGDASATQAPPRAARRWSGKAKDPFNLFGDDATRARQASKTKKVRSLESKAFVTLDLTEESSGETIRTRYKSLVKQYHPDANGGDKSSEERLRTIIAAYSHLKKMGFVAK